MNNKQIRALKPLKTQEWRQYEKGSLLENGLALNETATFIFSLCDGKTPVSDIVRKVTSEFDIDPETAEKDTVDCVQLLIEEGGLNA